MSPRRIAVLSTLVILARCAAADAATVFPTPGSQYSSPHTQISFRGVAPKEIGRITVRGSRSGTHAGVVRAHSDGEGVSWIPSKSFRGGERVSVTTQIGISGASNGDFGFTTAVWPGSVRTAGRPDDTVEPGKVRRFRSRPDLIPPYLTVGRGSGNSASGHVFLTPKAKNDTLQAGPMIADASGRPVWFQPLPGVRAATDLRVQTYRGAPVLTWWEGTSRQGIGRGEYVIMGQDYRVIKRVRAPNGYRGDLHEFLITPQDTALFITYPIIKANLRGEGGSRDGQLADSVVQEVDIPTGLMLFEWHARGTVALADSYIAPDRGPRVPWDYVHANSVALDSDGNILVSGRNTWAVYKLDRRTGRILWKLGGRDSTYRLGRGARFAWQHDAQRRADGTLTIFDNSASPAVARQSRAITLRLDDRARTASLVNARTHPRRLLAATQGNYQTLPGGRGFVGWGSRRYATEYDAAGRIVWDARLSIGFESYRAYRFPWVGMPTTDPHFVAQNRRGGGMTAHVSWNGATEVVTWELLGGATRDRLAPLGRFARLGFETGYESKTRTAYAAVVAYNKEGTEIGRSVPVRVRG